jgi:hypothetical protein
VGYMIRLSLAMVVTANYIPAEMKVLHIIIQDLRSITVSSFTNVFDYETFHFYFPLLLS